MLTARAIDGPQPVDGPSGEVRIRPFRPNLTRDERPEAVVMPLHQPRLAHLRVVPTDQPPPDPPVDGDDDPGEVVDDPPPADDPPDLGPPDADPEAAVTVADLETWPQRGRHCGGEVTGILDPDLGTIVAGGRVVGRQLVDGTVRAL